MPVPTADEMLAGFSAMRHLTHLRLTHIFGVDALLACLHAAPSLRVLELNLVPQDSTSASFSGSIHPTAGAVRALLGSAPQLEVRLLVASAREWLAGYGGSSLEAELTEQWNQLQRDFSNIPRVTIVGPPAEAPSD